MKSRQEFILRKLLDDSFLEINNIMSLFNISKRTILNDLKYINYYLKTILDEEKIITKQDTISLTLNINEYKKIKSYIGNIDYYDMLLTTEERLAFIIKEIIKSYDFITIDFICEKFFISRSTVNSDMIKIKKWFFKKELEFISFKSKGLKLNISEIERRILLSEIFWEYRSIEVNKYQNLDSCINKFFKIKNLLYIKNLLADLEVELGIYITDNLFNQIVVSIIVSFYRIKEDYSLKLKDKSSIENYSNKYYLNKISEQILDDFKENDVEVEYISSLIFNKILKIHLHYEAEEIKLQMLVEKLIDNISKELNINFRYDLDLKKRLLNHLTYLESTVTEYLPTYLINDFKKTYSKILDALKKQQKLFNLFLNKYLADDDLAYLSLHFTVAIDKIKIKNIGATPKIIVACNNGIAISNLIKNELEKNFEIVVKDVLPFHLLHSYLQKNNVDLIISTQKLDDIENNICVNAIPTTSDIHNIGRKLLDINGFSLKAKKGPLAEKVYSKILEYPDCKSEDLLLNELIILLNTYKKEFLENTKRRFWMLSELLKFEYIKFNGQSTSWQDAIEEAGKILLNDNVITEEYIKDAINNMEKSGPYIVITKGVAIPHADNKVGVNKTAISLLILEEPIAFMDSDNNPVKYIFMLATKDSDSHIIALADLVDFLGDIKFMTLLEKSKNANSIIEYIKLNENKKV